MHRVQSKDRVLMLTIASMFVERKIELYMYCPSLFSKCYAKLQCIEAYMSIFVKVFVLHSFNVKTHFLKTELKRHGEIHEIHLISKYIMLISFSAVLL